MSEIQGLTGWVRYHDLQDYQDKITDLIIIESRPPEDDLFNQEVQVDICIRAKED